MMLSVKADIAQEGVETMTAMSPSGQPVLNWGQGLISD